MKNVIKLLGQESWVNESSPFIPNIEMQNFFFVSQKGNQK